MPTGSRRSEIAFLQPAVDLFLEGLGPMSEFSSVSFIHKYFFKPD
jgi:hypothetical protein